MSAHTTPAPWSVGPTLASPHVGGGLRHSVHVAVGEGDSTGNTIAVVHMGGPGATSVERAAVEANARLIAAAPDLYRACHNMLRCLETAGEDGDWPHSVSMLRAAIAKATGEEA